MTTVYATVPQDAAENIASTLVEAELAACVNRFDCRSTYRWEGDVVTDEEVALVIKTTEDRCHDLITRLESIHPYDVPCIERFEETESTEPFSEWVTESVR